MSADGTEVAVDAAGGNHFMSDMAARTSEGFPIEPPGTRRRASGMKSPAQEDVVGQLRALLASETGAAASYGDASRAVRDPAVARRLAILAGQHAANANELRRQIQRLSGRMESPIPEGGSPWSRLSEITEGFLMDPTGWKSLRDRERLGLQRFRDALDRVDAGSREILLGSLIPAQLRNLRAWDEGASDS
jgi:hypothetical protein